MLRLSLPIIVFTLLNVVNLNAQASGFIVHANTPVDSISYKTLRLIYTLRYRQWSDDLSISLFVLHDDSPLHKEFVKKELNLFSHHLRRIWDRALFSGLSQIPKQLNSDQEMIKLITRTPGSMGYISGDIPPNVLIKQLKIRK